MNSQLLFLVFSLFFVKIFASSKDDNLDYSGFHTVSSMPYAVSDMTATSFEENIFDDNKGPRIYITGGCISDQTCTTSQDGSLSCFCQEITEKTSYYTPESDKWYTNNANMPRLRYRHMAAKVGNFLYVAGGRYLNDSIITIIDRYNPATNVWDKSYSWPNATSDGAAFAVGDLLFLVGGYDAYYNTYGYLEAFNTTSGTFLNSTLFPQMNTGRGDISVAELPNHKFYIIGGWTSGNFCAPSNVVELYDYHNNSWSYVHPLSTSRGDLAVGVMKNWIFAVGGETRPSTDTTCTHSIPVKYVERFVPANNTWDQEESIPDNLFRFVGASYNSSTNYYSSAIYLFGGQGTYDSSKQLYPIKSSTIKYIPKSTSDSNPPLDPGGIAGIVIAGIVIIILVVIGILAYMEYRRRHAFTTLNDVDDDVAHPKTRYDTIDKAQNNNTEATKGNQSIIVHHDLEAIEMREAFPDDDAV